jgi:hypothetical protein
MQTVKYSHAEPFNESRIARLFQHRHWNTEVAEEVIEAWRQSGMTKKEFARRFHAKTYRLEHWDRRLRKEKASKQMPVTLHPVKVTPSRRLEPSHAARTGPGVEMVLPSGAVLRINDGFDVATLRRVLEAVGC